MENCSALDVDVDVAWLYKGRKRVRQKGEGGEQGGERRGSSCGGCVDGVRKPVKSVVGGSDGELLAGKRAGSKAVVPSQSFQVKNVMEGGGSKGSSGSGGSSFLKRSSSVNEKPLKSLFGSLFGRRMSSPASPAAFSDSATSITANARLSGSRKAPKDAASKARDEAGQQRQVLDAKPINIVKRHSTSDSTSGSFAHLLNEPSSPEVHEMGPLQERKCPLLTPQERLPLKLLAHLSLKRVKFAVDKLGMDPPQQIPSRKPKRGNVLVPDDLICDIPLISQGISNTQGQLNQIIAPYSKASKEYKTVLENWKAASKESKKHQLDAHYAAQRIASEVANFKMKHSAAGNSISLVRDDNQDVAVEMDENIKKLGIDKPIHIHEYHFGADTASSDPAADGSHENINRTENELTLDQIYTRCCHLREILPIPSTLKQVKDKTAPLHTLKFLNPRPTLIDVLSFCDFIAVVPIHNLVFDNVNLTPEMFKIMLCSVVHSTVLERFSIRNVVIDSNGWLLFCKFLMLNRSLVKLDISHTKVKQGLEESLYRCNMDWSLLIQVLEQREGNHLEELLINGVQFTSFSVFGNLLNAFTAKPAPRKRLGVAQSELTEDQIKILLDWASQNNLQGIDIAFNNLSTLVKPIVSRLSNLNLDSLQYFTLNSTGIESFFDAALILRALKRLPNLYFLDLSHLPGIYPDVFPYLNKYLPKFPNLKRIHLDNNEFSSNDISLLSQILVKCKELLHISLLHQPKESFNMNSAASLYDFVKNSNKLTNLDIDYEFIPQEVSSRMAVCLIRNAQKSMGEDFHLDELTCLDELLFDGALITETAGGMLSKLDISNGTSNNDASRIYLLKKYWEKINRVRDNVQNTIDDLFEKLSSQKLCFQRKENLLRLLFVEATLSNILEILSNSPQLASLIGDNSGTELKHVQSSSILLPALQLSDADMDNGNISPSQMIRPHLMATDSGCTIDLTTGRPIPSKQSSETSIFFKQQEEEEGELHKWGIFVQQKSSTYSSPVAEQKEPQPQQIPSRPGSSSLSKGPPILITKIPSGAELKEAIIKAKGINSIEDLIDNVSHNRIKLENIYGIPYSPTNSFLDFQSVGATTQSSNTKSANTDLSTGTTTPSNSVPDDEELDLDVDETYDKLLNNLSKVRSNK
ncbi:Her1p Ecym_8333 [Eremothecium cymbalariae DBVPG|uniref:GLC7-interacting protein 3 n=1 Tax=Eremothecium cymbalariae (strain CBS 270.75 / DBVPG 7215 / KCTC 17166 / NRRL Y-17582) TaxID=931890 RepID=G8JXN7_ERECY|nr:Hypothetical protein Ecym_8333 [Eremothecium cymbalariae DBVPG\